MGLSTVNVGTTCTVPPRYTITHPVTCRTTVCERMSSHLRFSGSICGGGLQKRVSRISATGQEEKPTKNVWALDFDGVVCDSCGESAQSAWKVCFQCTSNGAQCSCVCLVYRPKGFSL